VDRLTTPTPEARDRLGGRAFTSRLAGTEVELGGGFVHWFQPHVFAELTRYGIDFAVPPEPARWSYITQGQVRHGTNSAGPGASTSSTRR
jgi:monoamine oxidase